MSQNWKGIFIFEEWMAALNRLPARTAMTVLNHVLRYQLEGVEPPAMTGNASLVLDIIMAHLRRSRESSLYGRMGVESKRRKAEERQAKALSQMDSSLLPPPVVVAVESDRVALYADLIRDREGWSDEARISMYAEALARREARGEITYEGFREQLESRPYRRDELGAAAQSPPASPL